MEHCANRIRFAGVTGGHGGGIRVHRDVARYTEHRDDLTVLGDPDFGDELLDGCFAFAGLDGVERLVSGVEAATTLSPAAQIASGAGVSAGSFGRIERRVIVGLRTRSAPAGGADDHLLFHDPPTYGVAFRWKADRLQRMG
ncbi:hypothetical protein GCM10010112_23160 [Actinoplanes lobatus]|uniref:Uncharacterized protein n=1 Tax=Actinoplanes lobatus TaxID=113568 RepID=A0A7W7HIU9_9ACTN|nr:hypothetical protein [Actinoplanes lobatus]MBB4751358.1 hypothetical protein [Actinoplanes lobatus]GGN63686.1 hypothetical protein GCM10010112_23160 [Actinoplanes lobatus]GIE40968.1 hypothetical protein Alo02nite_38660 [Actinoplanes lobatus]